MACLGAAVVAGGCASIRGAPDEVGSSLADDAGGAEADAPIAVQPREADVPPRERWDTPFAVSASGRLAPLEPRRVIVVGSDPNVAAGLAEQGAIELRDRNDARVAELPSVAEVPGVVPADGDVEVAGGNDGGPVVHRVVSGDTLSEIADRYNVSPAMIQRANGLIGDQIQVGQDLTIPVPGI